MPTHKIQEIQSAYRDPSLVRDYVAERFARPMGFVQHQNQVHWVCEALRRCEARRVLEIAPGPARLTPFIRGDFRGVAMDFSPEMLERARARLAAAGNSPPDSPGALRSSSPSPHWRLARGDAFHLPFAADSFDAIYTFRFVRHFVIEDRRRLYAQIRRVLRHGGIFMQDIENIRSAPGLKEISLPAPGAGAPGRDSALRAPAGWIYDARLTAAEVRLELEGEGFTVLDLRANIRHPRWQGQLDRKAGWGFQGLRRAMARTIERIPGGAPLEWLVLCRKM